LRFIEIHSREVLVVLTKNNFVVPVTELSLPGRRDYSKYRTNLANGLLPAQSKSRPGAGAMMARQRMQKDPFEVRMKQARILLSEQIGVPPLQIWPVTQSFGRARADHHLKDKKSIRRKSDCCIGYATITSTNFAKFVDVKNP